MATSKVKKQTRDLHAEVVIAAPLEAVWKALTDAEELTRWFPLEAGKNPEGTLWMSWRNEFRWDSRIEISEPPHHFRTITVESLAGEQQAGKAAAENTTQAEPTATDFYLEARGGKTVLRLVHSGFSAEAEWEALYDGTKRGWQFQLWSLQHYLENHRGVARRTAYVRTFLKEMTQAEAWQQLFGPQLLAQEGGIQNLQPGERYALRTAAGDHFTGVVRANAAQREFYGTVENLNNGILAVHTDALFGYRDVNFYVFTYGPLQKEMAALESRTRQLFQQVLS